AHAQMSPVRAVRLEVRRDGQTLSFTYDVTSRRATSPSRLREASPEMIAGVREVSENRYEVSRKVFDEVLSTPERAARSARVVPVKVDGKFAGLRLFGMRSRSLPV